MNFPKARRNGQSQPVSSLQNTAGTTCLDTDHSCFRANGSGWYLVEDTEVEDHIADHCYFVGARPDGGQLGCAYQDETFDVGWKPPATTPWSLPVNLDWLAGFAGP